MNGTVVCITAQNDQAVRYVKLFAGVGSMTFCNKATAIRLNRSGSMSQRIAGILRDEAANGKTLFYHGSAQAQTAEGNPLPGEPLFAESGALITAVSEAGPNYVNKKDANGIWRVLPPRRRVPSGFAIDIAMIYNGRARAEVVVSDTEINLIDKVFDPTNLFFAAFVFSLPVADVVEDAPVEVPPTDLTTLEPMTREEYNSIPAALAQRKNIQDPVFRKRLNLMLKKENEDREQLMKIQAEANADA